MHGYSTLYGAAIPRPAVEEALTGCRFRLEDMAQRLCAAGLAEGAGEDLRCMLARQNL